MASSEDILPIGAFTRGVSSDVGQRKPADRSIDDIVYRPHAFGADWTLDVRRPGEARRSVFVWQQGDVVFVTRRVGANAVGGQETVRRDRDGIAGVAKLVAWIWEGGDF